MNLPPALATPPAAALGADPALLAAAFAAFTTTARELQVSYTALERETARLRRSLRAARAQRLDERRRVEQVLARHRRLATLGEMAATLAHQIRTPLAAALLYAGNAARPDLPLAQRDGQLGKAIHCLQDLEQLVSEMLGFARGARPVEAPFELDELVAAADEALRPQLTDRQVLVIGRVPAGVPLRGSRENLAGALLNLACNALQAGGATARIRIAARVTSRQATITVSDNGPGIAAELQPRIFEPFVTTRPDGTGLGLAVARSVAQAHQGDVELIESRPGRTSFALRLPLAALPAPQGNASPRTDREHAA
jgi:two-component system sensor histidine kinase FlrB